MADGAIRSLPLARWKVSALGKACEDFAAGGQLPRGLRPDIAASWKRCRLSGVSPEQDITSVPVGSAVDGDSRLLRVVRPALDHLAERLSDTCTSIILTDPSARILDRWVAQPGLRRMLDRVGAVTGAFFGEEFAGTNGLGTPAEERRVVPVAGPEHFVEALRVFTCVGVPIRHPVTGRFEGVLDITCRYEDTSALLVPVILNAASAMEKLLLEEASTGERVLMEEFMGAARRSNHPVIVLNGHVIISNPAAQRLLAPVDHLLLWERAAEVVGTREGIVEELQLSQGTAVSMRCRRIIRGNQTVGAFIELGQPLCREESRALYTPAASSGGELVGRGTAHRRLCAEMSEHAAHRLPLLIVGEPGVGKLVVARAIHRCSAPGQPMCILDAALSDVEGSGAWLGQVWERLVTGSAGTLVVRHLDLLDRRMALGLSGLIETAPNPGMPRIIGIFTHQGRVSGSTQALLDRFPSRIVVPPLRERTDDIPELVRTFIRKHASADAGARCTPEVLRALARFAWPDNVRELENVICSLLLHRRRGDIDLNDLPAEIRRAASHRPLTRLEQIERDAIVDALNAARGNKTEAAETLGISRTTLYRKLIAYGISVNRTLLGLVGSG